MDRREAIEAAAAADAEAADTDFKDRFDPKSPHDWCEIVKDLVAMANSGGGCIVFGVSDDGACPGWDPRPLVELDPAVLTDKIAKYTGVQFADVAIAAAERRGVPVGVIAV